MIPHAHDKNQLDMHGLFRKYAADVRRDRRLDGENIHTLSLNSTLESRDSVTLDARIEGGVVMELGYRVRSCSLAQATTGIILARVPGITALSLKAAQQDLELVLRGDSSDEALLNWPELMILQAAAGMPDRHEVALLPFYVLQQLIALQEC